MRAFLDLLARYPGMLEAFEALPEFDRAALHAGLRDCVISPAEETAMIIGSMMDGAPMEGGEG